MSGNTTQVVEDPRRIKRDKAFKLMGIDGSTKAQKVLGMNESSAKELVKISKKSKKFDKEQHKKDVEGTKERVLYEDRLSRSLLMLKELRTFAPVSNDLVAEFEKAHNEGGAHADQREWAKASKALHKVHLKGTLEKAQEAWSKACKTGENAAPEAFALSKELLITIRKDDVGLPLDAVRKFESSATGLMRPLLAATPSQDEIRLATEGMQLLRETLQQNLDNASDDRREVMKLRGDAGVLLELVAPVSPPPLPLLTDREAAVLRERERAGETAFASLDYGTAREILAALVDDAKEIKSRMETVREDWIAVSSDVQGYIDRAAKLVKRAESPEIKADAETLMGSLGEIAKLGPGKGLPYPEATSRVSGAGDTLDRLETADEQWWAFRVGKEAMPGRGGRVKAPPKEPKDLPIGQAQERVAKLIKKAELAFGPLQEAVVELTDGESSDIADDTFRERLAQIETAWEKRVATATDLPSLDELGATDALVTLIQDIDAAANDPQVLSRLVLVNRMSDAQINFANARDPAMRRAEALLAVDPLEGGKAVSEIEAIDDRARSAKSEQDLIKAAAEVRKIGLDAEKRTADLQDSTEGTRQQLQSILQGIAEALAGLLDSANKAKSAEKTQKPLLALHATLQSGYDGLRAMAKATQLSLLDDAVAEGTAFAKEVDKSIRAAKGEKSDDDDSVMTFDKIRRTIADYKNELADKDFKKYATVTEAEISERIGAVESGLGDKTMTEMTKEVAEIGSAIEGVKQKAAEAKKWFKAFEDGVEKIRDELKAPAFKEFGSYVAATKKRLDGVLADGRFEGGLEAARNAAAKIAAEIKEMLESPKNERGEPSALADKEREALEASRKQDLDKAKFKGEGEVLEKQLNALSGIDDSEVRGMKLALKEARKAVETGEKSGAADYASGRDQLAAIRKRAALLEANPNGLAITSRNKLPQVCQRVKGEIIRLNDALAHVKGAIEKLPDADLDKAGKTTVTKQVAGVRALFNPTVFDGPIAKIADKTTKGSDRSAARELALREMRRLQAVMQTDYRLQALSRANPFHGAFPSVASGLMLALLDLENNLLVSM